MAKEKKTKKVVKPGNFNLGGSHSHGRARMASLAESIGRKFGRSTVLPLSIAPVARVMRLPFGVIDLDWKTGGGLPIGRITRLWGRKSTLKSTLCLRVLRSAQNFCRHCKSVLAVVPGEFHENGDPVRNCQCPDPRWWLANEDDYVWLSNKDAIDMCYGRLPEGAKTLSELGEDGGLRAVKVCDPPQHLPANKTKKIVFSQMFRCEPWRCVYLDSERSIDKAWARANGVDTSLVNLVGGNWAERCYSTLEEAALSRDADLIIIDSTSVLEPGKELEKDLSAAPKVAARAVLISRFMRRHLAAASQDGLTARYAPTLLTVSQVTCVAEGTFLCTDKGMETAKELHTRVEGGQSALIADFHGKLSSVQGSLDSGILPVRKITAQLGYETTVGEEHPFLVLQPDFSVRWTKSKNLCVGDYVAVHRGPEMGDECSEEDLDLANLAGVWAADGSTRHAGTGSVTSDTVRVSEKSVERYEYAKNSFRKVMGDAVCVNAKDQKAKVVAVYGKHATTLMEKGFVGKNRGVQDYSKMKAIPKCGRSSRSSLLAFLCGATFDTSIANSLRISLGRRLSREVQVALRYLGITSRLCMSEGSKGRMYPRLTVGGVDLDRFMDICDFAESSMKTKVIDHIKKKRCNRSYGDIPCDGVFANKVRKLKTHIYSKDRKTYRRVNLAVSRGTKITYIDVRLLGDDQLTARADENYLWLKVKSVDGVGEAQCYDFDVKHSDTLLADGFVTHNTKGLGYGQRAYQSPTDGNAADHAISLDIYMREAGYTFNDEKTHAIWGKFEFTVKKNKAGGSGPGTQGMIKYWLRAEPDHPVGCSDDLATVIAYARKIGVITVSKGKLVLDSLYVEEDERGFGTLKALTKFLHDNDTVYMDLRQRVLKELLRKSEHLEMVGVLP